MPTVTVTPSYNVVKVDSIWSASAATQDKVSALENELSELRNILQKISDKLQDGGEFDDELRRLLFGI